MPKGDWLHRIAIGGILVACLVLTRESEAQGNPPAKPAQTQQQQPAPAPPSVIQQPVSQPAHYTADCQRPKDHEEADLCEQRRQAQAAEDSVWWAKAQTFLGVFGAALVILSLFFTGWAAIAASRAAKAAEAAVHQEDEREGPFIYPVVVNNPYRDAFATRLRYDNPASPWGPYKAAIGFQLKNFGRSPALLQFVMGELVHLPAVPVELPFTSTIDTRVAPVLEPGTSTPRVYQADLRTPLDKDAAGEIIANKSFLFFIGRINFVSVNGIGYDQKFCLAYDHASASFISRGPHHNKRSRVYQI